MEKPSNAQNKILNKIRQGAVLQFDSATGRYMMREGSSATYPGLRTVEALLRAGALEKDIMGRCRLVGPTEREPEGIPLPPARR